MPGEDLHLSERVRLRAHGVRRRVGALGQRGEVAIPVKSGDASPHSITVRP